MTFFYDARVNVIVALLSATKQGASLMLSWDATLVKCQWIIIYEYSVKRCAVKGKQGTNENSLLQHVIFSMRKYTYLF